MGVIQNLDKALKTHDWYYEMSDDHRIWKKGSAELKNIHNLIKQVGKKDSEYLWNKYLPKGHPKMFPFPKHLTKEESNFGDKKLDGSGNGRRSNKNRGGCKVEDIVPGGMGDSTSENEVCPKQLKVGITVEKEHASNPMVAKEIAIDHLTEDPEYYSKLIKSGLVDEPEAINLAKKLGLTEAVQIGRLRNIIREEVKKLLKAK